MENIKIHQQYDPEIIWRIITEQVEKHKKKVGFIESTKNKFPKAPTAEQDIKAFAYLFLLQGTNLVKCLECSNKQLTAYLSKRISQYGIYKGMQPQTVNETTLTLEKIVGLFPHIPCELRKLGLGKKSPLIPDLSSLGVSVPRAMQTIMFAGICPSGLPKYCLYFYYHFAKKVFQEKLDLEEIIKRVYAVYAGNFFNPGRRQILCLDLGLANSKDGMWSWKPKIREVLMAAEKAWEDIVAKEHDAQSSDSVELKYPCGVYHCLD